MSTRAKIIDNLYLKRDIFLSGGTMKTSVFCGILVIAIVVHAPASELYGLEAMQHLERLPVFVKRNFRRPAVRVTIAPAETAMPAITFIKRQAASM